MNELNKKGFGMLSVFLIILGIAALVTILVIVFHEEKDPIIVNSTPEALDFSKQKGCNVEGGEIWCGITQKCYNVKTEKCESTTITDQYGCKVNEGQTWCNEGGKCINKGEACTPKPVVTPPITPPKPVVNTTPINVTTNMTNPNSTLNLTPPLIPPVQNLTPPINPNNTFNPNVSFNPNTTGGNNS